MFVNKLKKQILKYQNLPFNIFFMVQYSSLKNSKWYNWYFAKCKWLQKLQIESKISKIGTFQWFSTI